MTPHNELRLLPWSGPDGKPCYLSTDDEDSHLSQLADKTEALQLSLAAALLVQASDLLTGAKPDELRLLVTDLTGALRAVLRVAESRGHQLRRPGASPHGGGDEGPRLPAGPFG
ncbi:hypothetical protein ACFYNX_07875 [Streptomyces sp. NPDC007872]|uniref:hypothetical protein n=1 Tax=Streptomyces sp. NPDC007872 TaxID=3364782 RepID=UPI0036B5FADE